MGVMSLFSRGVLFFWYRAVYCFARLRGSGAADADVSARCVALRRVGRVIDARTQVLARQIFANSS